MTFPNPYDYGYPEIVPFKLKTSHDGTCIVQSPIVCKLDQVLDFANKQGGRWMLWSFGNTENPYKKDGYYNWVLKKVEVTT